MTFATLEKDSVWFSVAVLPNGISVIGEGFGDEVFVLIVTKPNYY
jgi:hypothetical protein